MERIWIREVELKTKTSNLSFFNGKKGSFLGTQDKGFLKR